MTLLDTVVNTREAVLSRILSFADDAILNDAEPTGPPLAGSELAIALKRSANALKAAAIDAEGRQVDYDRLRASEAYAGLRRNLTPQLRSLDLSTLATREQRLAFWITLYNVLVLDATVTFGVSRSVTEGWLGVVSFFRKAAYDVGGQRFSANDIEHGILRANRPNWTIPGPQFGPRDPRLAWRVRPFDPRIHFALNCASRSCPPIGVYDAQGIDAQLDLAAASFVANDVAIDTRAGLVRLSSIFKWYRGDFGGRAGVIAFLKERLPEGAERDWLRRQSHHVKLIYCPYDWGLNSVR
jgi:hypothetical protein